MSAWYDVTFPVVPLAGTEVPLEELTKPDERSLGCGLEIEQLQSPFLQLSRRLSARTPDSLRQRIAVACNLATYGFFCYELHAVSVFWSVSCIEMALKLRFAEGQPDSLLVTKKQRTEEISSARLESHLRRGWRIEGKPDFNYSFRSLLSWAFEAHLLPADISIPVQEITNSYANRFELEIFPEWAREQGLLSEQALTLADIRNCWDGLSDEQRTELTATPAEVLTSELPNFRNEMAHPKHYNFVVTPGTAVRAFDLLTDIVSHLWSELPDSVSGSAAEGAGSG